MRRALTLAQTAAAFASPNPTVGCVLVREGVLLGEGAHFYDARDHAEIAALKQAAANGHDVRGATAYVTLEPCSHHGRTGPCADALVTAGIGRCAVATVDPNPLVRGSGLAKLRAAAVQVDVFPIQEAQELRIADVNAVDVAWNARRLNDGFAFSIVVNRPFVTLKAAVSVDGMLAPPPSSRPHVRPHWLTGEAARNDVQQLRHRSDAILIGIGTVLADNPTLTDRTGLPRRKPLLRVVLDTNLRTPRNSQLVESIADDLLVVCDGEADAEHERQLRDRGAEVARLAFSSGRINLPAVLEMLFVRGVRSLLLEGGSTINAAFLQHDLVDKAVLYYSPSELGLMAVHFAQGAESPYSLQQRLSGLQRISFPNGAEEDVRLTGYLHDPWANMA